MVSYSTESKLSTRHQQIIVRLTKTTKGEGRHSILLHSFKLPEEANKYENEVRDAIRQGIHGHRELRALRSYNTNSVSVPSPFASNPRHLPSSSKGHIKLAKPNRRQRGDRV